MPILPPWGTLLRSAFWGSAAVVLYLALGPEPPRLPLLLWDKFNHVLAFAVLAGLGLLGWPGRPRRVLAGLAAYGGAIELLQALLPTRVGDWRDLLADAVGLLLGTVLVRALHWRRAPGA